MAAVFDDIRLPEDIEVGAKGGPRWQTTVIDLSAGNETRNQDWSEQRHEYDIAYGISSLADLRAVRHFFMARRGKARGFRFKDWSDYVLDDEAIGTGAGGGTASMQIIKTYESGGPHPYGRRITRPVADTLVVRNNGVVMVSGYTLGLLGVIAFSPSVASGHVISVDCDFDVPVRFDTDVLDLTQSAFEAGEIDSIPVMELRE